MFTDAIQENADATHGIQRWSPEDAWEYVQHRNSMLNWRRRGLNVNVPEPLELKCTCHNDLVVPRGSRHRSRGRRITTHFAHLTGHHSSPTRSGLEAAMDSMRLNILANPFSPPNDSVETMFNLYFRRKRREDELIGPGFYSEDPAGGPLHIPVMVYNTRINDKDVTFFLAVFDARSPHTSDFYNALRLTADPRYTKIVKPRYEHGQEHTRGDNCMGIPDDSEAYLAPLLVRGCHFGKGNDEPGHDLSFYKLTRFEQNWLEICPWIMYINTNPEFPENFGTVDVVGYDRVAHECDYARRVHAHRRSRRGPALAPIECQVVDFLDNARFFRGITFARGHVKRSAVEHGDYNHNSHLQIAMPVCYVGDGWAHAHGDGTFTKTLLP